MEWVNFSRVLNYDDIHERMEALVLSIREQAHPEQIWLLEHEPVITLGTSFRGKRVDDIGGIPVRQVGRGGKATYHGPGQRMVYLMVDLRRRGLCVTDYMASLQDWVVASLAALGVESYKMRDPLGVWVDKSSKPHKVAAFGVRVSRGVAWHGIGVNIKPELRNFSLFEPCGLSDDQYGVTSLACLQSKHETNLMQAFDNVLFKNRHIVYSDIFEDIWSKEKDVL